MGYQYKNPNDKSIIPAVVTGTLTIILLIVYAIWKERVYLPRAGRIIMEQGVQNEKEIE